MQVRRELSVLVLTPVDAPERLKVNLDKESQKMIGAVSRTKHRQSSEELKLRATL